MLWEGPAPGDVVRRQEPEAHPINFADHERQEGVQPVPAQVQNLDVFVAAFLQDDVAGRRARPAD